jgi:hypothetical protein
MTDKPMDVERTCHANAGICPKAPRTYGEPHYCSLKWPHVGLHRCKNCGMEYNSDSNFPFEAERRAALKCEGESHE